MAKKNKKERMGVVYSTNPEFNYAYENDQESGENVSHSRQKIRVSRENKGRGGKTVSIIRGFEGSFYEQAELAKILKQSCGAGGSVKDGEIIIQGDQVEQIIQKLNELGYKDTKKGGG